LRQRRPRSSPGHSSDAASKGESQALSGPVSLKSARKRHGSGGALRGILSAMIRIREIVDPELRRRIIGALAERRGISSAAIPDWYELDDLDYVDLLNDLREQDHKEHDIEREWRM